MWTNLIGNCVVQDTCCGIKEENSFSKTGPEQWVKIRLHLGVGLSLDESANKHTNAADA